MRRATALQPGDKVYVTGTIGDAYLGLQLRSRPSVAANWGRRRLKRNLSKHVFCAQLLRCNSRRWSARMHRLRWIFRTGSVKDLERLCRASGAGRRSTCPACPFRDLPGKSSAAVAVRSRISSQAERITKFGLRASGPNSEFRSWRQSRQRHGDTDWPHWKVRKSRDLAECCGGADDVRQHRLGPSLGNICCGAAKLARIA